MTDEAASGTLEGGSIERGGGGTQIEEISVLMGVRKIERRVRATICQNSLALGVLISKYQPRFLSTIPGK